MIFPWNGKWRTYKSSREKTDLELGYSIGPGGEFFSFSFYECTCVYIISFFWRPPTQRNVGQLQRRRRRRRAPMTTRSHAVTRQKTLRGRATKKRGWILYFSLYIHSPFFSASPFFKRYSWAHARLSSPSFLHQSTRCRWSRPERIV